jgi:hypothetical protein
VKLNETSFIKLLRKSESFAISEAFSKVKNAKPIAVFEEKKAIVMQDKNTKDYYYAEYKLNEGFIELNNVEKFEFQEKDYESDIKENVKKIFDRKAPKESFNVLANTIKEIITEQVEAKYKINKKVNEILKEEHLTFINKPKISLKNPSAVKASLEKLKENKDFSKFISETEQKISIPLFFEEIDWSKKNGKLYSTKFVGEEKKKEVIKEAYSAKGFKKSQLRVRNIWKDAKFRDRLKEAITDTKKLPVFLEMYKNITLLGERGLKEELSKALLSVSETNKINENLNLLIDEIKKNKKNMITWDLITEQAPGEEADAGAPAATAPQAPSPETAAPEASPNEPSAMTAIPEEPGMPTDMPPENDLATESTQEVAIINALLTTVEDVFWNGNQENKELANLIKEIRDMRASGNFDEQRLEEIFKDLFSITQQIGTSPQEEVSGAEAATAEGVPTPAEGETPTPASTPSPAGEESGVVPPTSPLETY